MDARPSVPEPPWPAFRAFHRSRAMGIDPSVRSQDWRNRAALRIREVAELLGVQPATVRRLVRERELPALRLGRILVVPTHALRSRLGEVDAPTSNAPAVSSESPRAVRSRATKVLVALRSGTDGKRE